MAEKSGQGISDSRQSHPAAADARGFTAIPQLTAFTEARIRFFNSRNQIYKIAACNFCHSSAINNHRERCVASRADFATLVVVRHLRFIEGVRLSNFPATGFDSEAAGLSEAF